MAHPKSLEATQIYLDSNPFLDMKIDDTKILNELKGRSPCPLCKKSRKYFCYTCYVPIEELEGRIPTIKVNNNQLHKNHYLYIFFSYRSKSI